MCVFCFLIKKRSETKKHFEKKKKRFIFVVCLGGTMRKRKLNNHLTQGLTKLHDVSVLYRIHRSRILRLGALGVVPLIVLQGTTYIPDEFITTVLYYCNFKSRRKYVKKQRVARKESNRLG